MITETLGSGTAAHRFATRCFWPEQLVPLSQSDSYGSGGPCKALVARALLCLGRFSRPKRGENDTFCERGRSWSRAADQDAERNREGGSEGGGRGGKKKRKREEGRKRGSEGGSEGAREEARERGREGEPERLIRLAVNGPRRWPGRLQSSGVGRRRRRRARRVVAAPGRAAPEAPAAYTQPAAGALEGRHRHTDGAGGCRQRPPAEGVEQRGREDHRRRRHVLGGSVGADDDPPAGAGGRRIVGVAGGPVVGRRRGGRGCGLTAVEIVEILWVRAETLRAGGLGGKRGDGVGAAGGTRLAAGEAVGPE